MFTWLLAAFAALFHVLVGTVPVVTASPHDWGPAVQLSFLDFPIVLLIQFAGLNRLFEDASGVWLLGILGTAMYAGAGALVGYGIDRLRSRRRLCKVSNRRLVRVDTPP
jgi:hypothetical protein